MRHLWLSLVGVSRHQPKSPSRLSANGGYDMREKYDHVAVVDANHDL